ncbi:MAG: hypothetical protein LAO21_22415 [Acidobacteriia bacterium]|nr:hypothetical protein [Terriglobia bacterium]
MTPIYRKTTLVLVLIAALAVPLALRAQSGPKACSMLTVSELEEVMGAKITSSTEGDIPYKKGASSDHEGTLMTCHWKMGARSVSLVYSTGPVTAEGKKQGENKIKASEEALRQEGYKVDKKDFGNMKCSTMVAPVQQTVKQFSTSCGTEKGRMFVTVSASASGQGDLVPMEKIKTLTEKAASRLP